MQSAGHVFFLLLRVGVALGVGRGKRVKREIKRTSLLFSVFLSQTWGCKRTLLSIHRAFWTGRNFRGLLGLYLSPPCQAQTQTLFLAFSTRKVACYNDEQTGRRVASKKEVEGWYETKCYPAVEGCWMRVTTARVLGW